LPASQTVKRRKDATGRGSVREQIVKGEAVDVGAGSGEIGMDLEKVLIADHQQGRILQVFPVIIELEIRALRSLCLPLYSHPKCPRFHTSA
jgi:hypothetical protein